MKVRASLVQLAKYGIIGIGNTLLTAVIIWLVLKFIFGVNGNKEASLIAMTTANICGYVAGLINSFIFNRSWTFKSHKSWRKSFLKFVAGFAGCYVIQLTVVLLSNESNVFSPIRYGDYTLTAAYICQLMGIIVYTVLNFMYNKYYAFRE
jgi:putative flippase GtrA